MRYPNEDAIKWQFDTKHWRIVFHVEPEDMDPEGNFASGDDALDAETVAFCREGGSHWFQAIVSVWYGRDEHANLLCMGWDTLGGCSYRSYEEFISSHRDKDPEQRNTLAMKASNRAICHYFPDMVTQAVQAARQAASGLKLREVA